MRRHLISGGDEPSLLLSGIYKLPVKVKRRVLFTCYHRRIPNLNNPTTFSDKMNWRILNDKRPLLEWTCDKLAMKEHATGVPGLAIARTLWRGTDLRELALAGLPEHWVLKPNNRSGPVYFGHGRPDISNISQITKKWLRATSWTELGEWAYLKARPVFFVEEVIGTPGSPPPDYKFYVFEGNVAAIEVHVGRHSDHQIRLYRPDWSPLKARFSGYRVAPLQPPPVGLDIMLAVAAKLGSGFDFVRIDLYDLDGKVYFGEFSPYSASGLDRIIPSSFDAELGASWHLP